MSVENEAMPSLLSLLMRPNCTCALVDIVRVIGLLCTLVTVPLNTRRQSKPFCLRAYDVLPTRATRSTSVVGSIEEHMTALRSASGKHDGVAIIRFIKHLHQNG